MPAELFVWVQVSFMLRRAEPGVLDTTFSSINDICASKTSSSRITTYERFSINRQNIICPTKLVKQITLFEQRKKSFKKFSYLSATQLYGNLEYKFFFC